VLAGDQGNSITLRVAGGDSMTILKSEIDTLQSTGLSLMPEGLEQNVTPEEMNDLITFIKNWRYLDGKIPFEQQP
jgi:putative heme-binding domain-containing protein